MTPLELFEAHQGLAHAVAWKLRAAAPAARLEVEDLAQAGLMGLWHAAQRFEPERGLKFSTYATCCVRGYILTELETYRYAGHQSAARRIDMSQHLLCGIDASDEATIDLFGEAADDVFESVALADDIAHLEASLGRLPDRHAFVLRGRAAGRTLAEIGADLGVCRERVSQLHTKALPELRRAMSA